MTNLAFLYREPFLRLSKNPDGLYVQIHDRPCFKFKSNRVAKYKTREIDLFVKVCSAAKVTRVGDTILCSVEDKVVGVLTINYRSGFVHLKGKFQYDGKEYKIEDRMDLALYLSMADNDVLPWKIVVKEPVKLCTSEEKMLFPIHFNGKDLFYVVYKNGTIEIVDRVEAEVELKPESIGVLPRPPDSIEEGLECMGNVINHFREWAMADKDKARLMFGLWAHLGVYHRYPTKRIPFLFGPRGSGKTTLLLHVTQMASETTQYVANPSGPAMRDILTFKNCACDDINEQLTFVEEEDRTLPVILALYMGAPIARVVPETLKLRIFKLRGTAILAGAEASYFFTHRGIARRLLVLGIPRSFGFFKYLIPQEDFNMALSLLGLADEVNGYTHGVLPEDTLNSPMVIFNRYTLEEPKLLGTKPEDTIGDPILEFLVTLRNKILQKAVSDRFKKMAKSTGDAFSECFVQIASLNGLFKITYPEANKATYTLTETIGANKTKSFSKTVVKRSYNVGELRVMLSEYLGGINDLVVDYDRTRNYKVLVRIDCDASDVEISAKLKSIVAEIDTVIRSLLNGKDISPVINI